MTINTPDLAVSISGLNKTYAASSGEPPKTALTNVSLNIPQGSFFGLLGPNGAGKSTIINIMAGLVIKSSGSVQIWGYDISDFFTNVPRDKFVNFLRRSMQELRLTDREARYF